MKLEQLQTLVIEWAENKGLLTDVTPERIEKQTLKVLEEIGETAGAYLKGNREELIDGIGDIVVTLIILRRMMYNSNIEDIWYSEDMEVNSPANLMTVTKKFLVHEFYSALFYLRHFAKDNDLDIKGCLESAYNVIAKRTGKMVNGTFIKD